MNFLQYLQDFKGGKLLVQLSEEFQDVVASVLETNNKGKLTVSFTVERNGENAVTIVPAVNAVRAKAGVGSAIFFTDQGGNLFRNDPRQADIEDELAKKRQQQKDD